jgi:hypothetical protein
MNILRLLSDEHGLEQVFTIDFRDEFGYLEDILLNEFNLVALLNDFLPF